MADQISNDVYTEILLNHLLDGIKEYAIFMLNLEGEVVTWNSGVQRLLGYGEEEFLKKRFSMIFTPEDKADGVDERELKRALETGKAEDERWHRRKDGSVFWASGLVTRVVQDGRPIGFTKIMRDQTEKKLFEEELARHTAALASANKELEQFADVLTHDINAPLQTMCNLASLLKEKNIGDTEADESIAKIEKGARHVMTLVNDVLDYSKSERKSPEPTLVKGDELLHTVLSNLNRAIDEKNARIIASPLPAFWADETSFERVLQNLIENALKYSSESKQATIQISVTEDADTLTFSIRDNGPGIPPEARSRIFTLFERLNPEGQGRGLGLAIAKKLVQDWGGKIWVESQPGSGSNFYFTVPLTIPTELHEQPLPSSEPRTSGSH